MRCPSRPSYPSPLRAAGDENTEDTRADGTCAYCGSMLPNVFMQYVAGDKELTPTDKSYKVYTRDDPERIKFYFEHLSEDQMKEFISLLNAKKVKFAHPGGFYVTPFFIAAGDRP